MNFFSLCDLEMGCMTSKKNRVPLLCHFKVCASFHSNLWIQTGVTVHKCPNWDEIYFDLCDLDQWLLTLTFCMDITFENGNYMIFSSYLTWPVPYTQEPECCHMPYCHTYSAGLLHHTEHTWLVTPVCGHSGCDMIRWMCYSPLVGSRGTVGVHP